MFTRIRDLIIKIITLDGSLFDLQVTLGNKLRASLFVGRNDGHSLMFGVTVMLGGWSSQNPKVPLYYYLDLDLSLGVISIALSLRRK